MRKDTRLSRSLHVLIHMADHPALTSVEIATMLDTNSVVVRRTMAIFTRKGEMMRKSHGLGLLVVMLLTTSVAAGEIESGIEVDGKIGKYRCTKTAGADDGVKVGKSLCYT